MNAEYRHIKHAATLSVIESSAEIRERHLMLPICIEHPEWRSVLEHLEYLLEIPTTQQAEHMLLVSDAGLGKTHLLEGTIAAKNPPVTAPGSSTERPVLYYESPVARHFEHFQTMLLHALGAPDLSLSGPKTRDSLVIRLLAEAKVRLLIVDELNQLALCSDRVRLQIYNWIKYLANVTNIPIVLAGVRGFERPILDDPQLKSRFTIRQLHPWNVGPEFAAFLLAVEGCLPLRKPSYLHKRDMVKAIYEETHGNTRKVMLCLRHAARAALYSGQEFISMELLPSHRSPRAAHRLHS